MPTQSALSEFREVATRKLARDLEQIERCATLLSEEQLWQRPNDHCNSVANQILHLTGNVRQWIVTGIGGLPFDRNRDAEFSERGPLPIECVLTPLQEIIRDATAVIGEMTDETLERRHDIQGYDVTGMTAVFHVSEHFSFHTGQIVHITKAILDVDLSLFDQQGMRRVGQPGKLW